MLICCVATGKSSNDLHTVTSVTATYNGDGLKLGGLVFASNFLTFLYTRLLSCIPIIESGTEARNGTTIRTKIVFGK